MPEITHGAYLLAKVYHDAYQQAELESGGVPIAGWHSLSRHDRLSMALGFQKMLDLGIITPIGFSGMMKLRKAGWESVRTSRERQENP